MLELENLIEELQQISLLDDISKQLAERIVGEMQKQVRTQVKEPSISHYISFMLAYLRKSFDVVPLCLLNLVMGHVDIEDDQIIPGALQKLVTIIQSFLRDENHVNTVVMGLEIISSYIPRCIQKQKIPLGNFVECLTIIVCDKREQVSAAASEILALYTLYEFQQRLENGKSGAFDISNQIAVILCNLFQQDAKIMKHFLVNQQKQLLQWYLYELSGTPLLQLVLASFINGQHVSLIVNAVQFLLQSELPCSLQIIFLIFQCIIQSPSIITASAASQLVERMSQEEKQSFIPIINGEGVGALCTPSLYSLQSIVDNFISIVPVLIGQKIDMGLLQQCLIRIFRVVCTQSLDVDVVLKLFQLVDDFPNFCKSFQIFSQYQNSESKAKVFRGIGEMFNYYKQQNQQIAGLINYLLDNITPQLAMQYFQVGVLGNNNNDLRNVHMIKFIASHCSNLSIIDFKHLIFDRLNECQTYQIDKSITSLIKNQLFEFVQCSARKLDFSDFVTKNQAVLPGIIQELIEGVLVSDVTEDSVILVRFFDMYIQIFERLSHFKDIETDELQQQKYNFKIFVQQQLAPRLLPVLMNLILDDSHAKYQIVQQRMSANIIEIITQLFKILMTPIQQYEQNQNLFQFSSQFQGLQLISNSCKNIIRRIATFVNQDKVQKVQTLSILSAIMDVRDPTILGDKTIQIISTLLSQLLNNPAYADIIKASYKVLGNYSKLNKEESIKIFQSIAQHNVSCKLLYLQNFDFASIDEMDQFLNEIIVNIFNMNSKVREACYQLLDKYINELISQNKFETFATTFINELMTDGFQSQFFSQRCQVASVMLFNYGLYLRELINDEFIIAVVAGNAQMPQLPLIFEVFTKYCIDGIEVVQLDKLQCLKMLVNFIEIAFCNLQSQQLSRLLQENLFQNVYNIVGRDPKTHYRVPVKRLLVGAGICVGRNFMEEVLRVCDERLVKYVQQELIEKQLDFSLLKQTVQKFTDSGRKLASRVNKILKLIKVDQCYGRYEAGQYVILNKTVPSQLRSQLRNTVYKDDEEKELEKQDLNIGGLVYNEQEVRDADDEELERILAADGTKKPATDDDQEEDFVQKVEKISKEDEKQKVVDQIQEQLDKIRQRRLYKVDARFAHTGKEFANIRAGGDLMSKGSRLPTAQLPLMSQKQLKRLSKVNKDQLKQGLDAVFRKDTRVKMNLKKLGKHAAQEVKGGRKKVHAIRKHNPQQSATGAQKLKNRSQKKAGK